MEKTISTKGKILSRGRAASCVALSSDNKKDILDEALYARRQRSDMLEWRADYFSEVESIKSVLDVLDELAGTIPDTPLIFTLRRFSEGGYKKVSEEKSLEIIKSVIKSQIVDFIDIELSRSEAFIKEVVKLAHKYGENIIISKHDFSQTPAKDDILEAMEKMRALGCDIAKNAYTPTSRHDILSLLNASDEFLDKYDDILLVSVAMGQMGLATRICAGVFGSSITYGSGRMSSAPGQVPIQTLKDMLEIFQ